MPLLDDDYIRISTTTEFDVRQLEVTEDFVVREPNATIFANTSNNNIIIVFKNHFTLGKRVKVKNTGLGKVTLVDTNGSTIYTITSPQSVVELEFGDGVWYYI